MAFHGVLEGHKGWGGPVTGQFPEGRGGSPEPAKETQTRGASSWLVAEAQGAFPARLPAPRGSPLITACSK